MGTVASNVAMVEQLREQIRKLQAAPREYLSVLRTGVRALDVLLPGGGLPLGQATELCGEAASGRTSLALRAVAAATHESRLAAYVDGPGELYPPAAAALGVELSRLLMVRPKAPRQLGWTAVQLARSGAFSCVVLDLTHTGVRLSLAEGKKLQDAAIKGGTALLLLTPPIAPADGMIRLSVEAMGIEGFSVELLRSRQGRVGHRKVIPWDELYPGTPPAYRYQAPSVGVVEQPNLPRFTRVKTSIVRDGPQGFYASRPGRDFGLPELYPSLGVRK
ncbi:MAG: ImuA family protein [Myxococcaceae bacterium]